MGVGAKRSASYGVGVDKVSPCYGVGVEISGQNYYNKGTIRKTVILRMTKNIAIIQIVLIIFAFIAIPRRRISNVNTCLQSKSRSFVYYFYRVLCPADIFMFF